MDGMKLARFVSGRWPPIQIVATSGFVNVGKGDLPGRQSLSAKALPPGANEKTRLTAAEAAKRKAAQPVAIGGSATAMCRTIIQDYPASDEIRQGCVNTSNPSARAMAARVIPAASAIRTASAVGAETDTITGAPITALFCTISTETRLVRSMIPSFATTDARASAPESLSSAL